MKKIILLALTTLMIVGCNVNDSNPEKISNNYKIIKIDSCEFVECRQAGYSNGTFVVHLPSCRFCQERRQKELKELVEQLKEK